MWGIYKCIKCFSPSLFLFIYVYVFHSRLETDTFRPETHPHGRVCKDRMSLSLNILIWMRKWEGEIEKERVREMEQQNEIGRMTNEVCMKPIYSLYPLCKTAKHFIRSKLFGCTTWANTIFVLLPLGFVYEFFWWRCTTEIKTER